MKKNVFFVGIGGTGMSAIARLLQEKGYHVSGSDQHISDLAKDLISRGITVYEGHSADHLVGMDLVIRSSAISNANPEIQAAHLARIPVYKRADILGELMQAQKGIAIAGTHGKTTTTAMVAHMLQTLQLDPSYIIGSVSKNLKSNAHYGQGDYFIIEADEYDRMFLGLNPFIGVITTLEHDHPDCFPTFSDYLQAFAAFTQKILPGGYLFICQDDPGVQKLIPLISSENVITYGLSEMNGYQATNLERNQMGGYHFQVIQNSINGAKEIIEIDLSVPGIHNVLNALAAIGIAHLLQLDLPAAAKALTEFSGTARRFDIIGEVNGVTIIDDYAHHPTEIRATLQAARSKYPNQKLWAIWQPHTYSRTQTLFNEFVNCFQDADHVIISQVYASREHDNGFSAASIVAAMQHPDAKYIPSLNEIVSYLLEHLSPGDVMLVFSAGDAIKISQAVRLSYSKGEQR